MDKETLKEVLRKHRAWLDGEADGERANLSDAHLRRANLRDADLRDADLRDADLWGADLWGADLRGANLTRADLSGANLWGANLSRTNLSDAHLRRANLRDADLRDADLRDADLWGADLRGARGNRYQVKSLHALKWDVVWTDTVLAIGCMQYNIDEWLSFTDEQIEEMDSDALDFMDQHRDLILILIGRETTQNHTHAQRG